MAFVNRSTSERKAQPAHTVPTRVLPKRKRKETSYYPSDSEVSDSVAFKSDIDDEDMQPSKKAKVAATTVPAKPLVEKKFFPFMSLPPELKNKIYGYALISDLWIMLRPLIVHSRRIVCLRLSYSEIVLQGRSILGSALPSLCPKLLLLNKKTYAETQPILYGANRFLFEEMRVLHTFCGTIGPGNCASLQQLRIKDWYYQSNRFINYAGFTTLASAINITCLKLDCQFIMEGNPRRARGVARQFYRDSHLWLEAVGKAKGRLDAAVELISLDLDPVEYDIDLTEGTLDETIAAFKKELRVLLHNA
ncbi:MAG: hypothetical protein Q9186_005060 [Xanthomendoza sp. 1 TL-2023]